MFIYSNNYRLNRDRNNRNSNGLLSYPLVEDAAKIILLNRGYFYRNKWTQAGHHILGVNLSVSVHMYTSISSTENIQAK